MPTPYLKLLDEMEKLGMARDIHKYIDVNDDGKWSMENIRDFIINKQIPVITSYEEQVKMIMVAIASIPLKKTKMELLFPINTSSPYISSELFRTIDTKQLKFVTVDQLIKTLPRLDVGYEFMLENQFI